MVACLAFAAAAVALSATLSEPALERPNAVTMDSLNAPPKEIDSPGTSHDMIGIIAEARITERLGVTISLEHPPRLPAGCQFEEGPHVEILDPVAEARSCGVNSRTLTERGKQKAVPVQAPHVRSANKILIEVSVRDFCQPS